MNGWWSQAARRLARLRQVRGDGDLWLFWRIFFFAAAVPALLRLRLPTLEVLLEPKKTQQPGDRGTPRAEKIIDYVDAAVRVGHPLVRRSCLTRGLTAYHFLRQTGLDVSLAFGIGRIEGALTGHCWLVKDGEPYLEARDPRSRFMTVYAFRQGTVPGNVSLPGVPWVEV